MSEVTCRGAFALGTACGKCSRCRREIESYNAMKAVRDKLNTPSSALSSIAKLEAENADLKDKLVKAVDALGEAIYLCDPDEEDIAKETGLYRIVTTYAELTGGKDD